MPMLPPDDPPAAPWPPESAPSPFATPPTPARPAEPAAAASPLDDKTVEALHVRLQELKRRRAEAQPLKPRSAFSQIDWDGIRKKGWHAALIIGSAYISAKPEKYGWLMPVLTAVAGTSAPPTGKPGTGVAAVLATMLLTLGWRAWA